MIWDAVVVGAGPAGLATSRELLRLGVDHLLLERGARVGHSWTSFYDSLVLHTGKKMSALPGLDFPASTPVFVTRQGFLDYLERYASRFALPVRTGFDVTRIERQDDVWIVTGSGGSIEAQAVVVATGIAACPRVPDFPGASQFAGALFHSSAYRRPAEVHGRRVLVVGVGNSGGEIATELASTGRDVSIAVRSGANVVPRDIAGVPVQYLAHHLRRLPRFARQTIAWGVARLGELRRGPPVLPRPAHGPLDAIPIIGFHLVDAIRAGRVAVRPGVAAFTATGARFTDGREEPFDTIILATGFAAALAPLGDLVSVDDRGFACRTDRVTSADEPGLYFVGHNYDASGGLFNIARDATLAAARIARTLVMA